MSTKETLLENLASHPEPIREMVEWFCKHYANPSDILAVEPGADDFQYIYGGPFDAREVLEQYFGDTGKFSDTDIETAAVVIEKTGVIDWSPVPPLDGAVASLHDTATRMFDSLTDKEKALVRKRFEKKREDG